MSENTLRPIFVPYNRAKTEDNYDVICIGSGLGSLTAASLLGQLGRKVLVLEQHYTPGGYTHSFTREGKYRWDVGVHYLSDVSSRYSMTRIGFDLISDGSLSFHETDPIYERVIIGDQTFDYTKGKKQFVRYLKNLFPHEAKGIDRYFFAMEKAQALSVAYFFSKALPENILSRFVSPKAFELFQSEAKRTAQEVLDQYFKDPLLKTLLGAQCGDYGSPPSEASFIIQALVTLGFQSGASYPVGGAEQIAKSVGNVIRKHNGTIVTMARVQEILVEDDQATGVRMADGRVIRCKRIVSGVGVFNTFGSLLNPKDASRFGYPKLLASATRSNAHMGLYIGFKKGNRELKLPDRNFWIYPKVGIDDAVQGYLQNRDQPFPMVFINFPSAKDPSWDQTYPNSATATVLIFEQFSIFNQWKDTNKKNRGEDYKNLKMKYEKRMLDCFIQSFPHLKEHIDFTEVSTPLSTRHYMNYQEGEIYGIENSPKRFELNWLRPKTKVNNLFITGVDITADSVTGALCSGLITTMQMEPKNLFSLLLKKVSLREWKALRSYINI